MRSRIPGELLLPRHWPTWLGLGLLRLLCMLPLRVSLRIGEGLGWLAGKIARSRWDVVRTNIDLCFPDRPAAQREEMAREHVKAMGAGVIEAGLAWWASDQWLARRFDIEGLHHYDEAIARGGVLLLTGHFTTLELGARIVATQRSFHPMYRPLNNRLVDHLTSKWRSDRAHLAAIPKEDLRALVRALRAGRAIWYAPDQALDRRISVWAPFFGVPALTVTATARLAKMGRASVVPYFPERRGDRYILRFQPALANFPTGDDVADATRINQVIESGVRAADAQYFWVHKRFKVRPPGEPPVYRRRR